MLRLLMKLLGKDYEPCKGCEVLKNQLDIVNSQNDELRKVILDLVKPKVFEVPATPVEPIKPKVIGWNQKQKILEEQDRAEARIRREHEEKMRDIEKLERELGVEEHAG